MKFASTAVSGCLFLAANAQAFAPTFGRTASIVNPAVRSSNAGFSTVPLFASTLEKDAAQEVDGAVTQIEGGTNIEDPEVARLRSMAANLRAEAAALEAQRREEIAIDAQKAFDKFDTNHDGKISLDELKAGLEQKLKMDLPEERVRQLMTKFDASGDGALQVDEFVTVDTFRNQLEAMARDERKQARMARQTAMEEEETAKMLQAVSELINDKEPTATDKAVSVLPYLFPLLDVLPFGQAVLAGNPENPIAVSLATLFTLYKSIPLSGFVAFFALSYLAGDVSINRLVRFNMRQAIYLDIALFFPSLTVSVLAFVVGLTGNEVLIPETLAAASSTAVFATVVAAVGYSAVSSLAGAAPNKIPFLSKAVEERMPSRDMLIEAAKSGNLFLQRPDDENNRDEMKR